MIFFLTKHQHILPSLLFVLFFVSLSAQDEVHLFESSSSATFEISSTERGFLIPRMNTNQRLGINNPSESLLVYDLELADFFFFKNNNWHSLNGSSQFVFVKDFGAIGDGVTDDTDAILNAIQAASNQNTGLIFDKGKTYVTQGINLSAVSCPTFINGNGATLKFKSGGIGTLLELNNVHGTRAKFVLNGFILDANSTATSGLKIWGGQGMNISDLRIVNAAGDGVLIEGELGHGIYYNHFENIRSYGNQGSGFFIKSLETASFVGNNTFISLQAQFNGQHGWDIDWVNFTCISCSAEKNNLYGFNIDHTYSFDMIGGYSEKNHQGYANGSFDQTIDESFNLGVNTLGVKILGGRHIGKVSGTITGAGNLISHGNNAVLYTKWIGAGASDNDLNIDSNVRILNQSGYPYTLKMAGDYSVLEVTDNTHLTINKGAWQNVVIPNGKVGIGTNTPKSKLSVVGLQEYNDNQAALNAGLENGDFYRTGDVLKVVHE